jgi:hypothetical protein
MHSIMETEANGGACEVIASTVAVGERFHELGLDVIPDAAGVFEETREAVEI